MKTLPVLYRWGFFRRDFMEFRFLSDEFFIDYSHCVEMEKKRNRPYACMCIVEIDSLNFAIPIRHHIKHKHAIFTDKEKTQGLDLSKAVIILDVNKYVDKTRTAYISDEEFIFLNRKKHFIKSKMTTYIKNYKKAYANREISKNKILCDMSCLQYFHKELNID